MANKIRVDMRIEEDIFNALQDYADENGFSKSALCRLAIINLLKERGVDV